MNPLQKEGVGKLPRPSCEFVNEMCLERGVLSRNADILKEAKDITPWVDNSQERSYFWYVSTRLKYQIVIVEGGEYINKRKMESPKDQEYSKKGEMRYS